MKIKIGDFLEKSFVNDTPTKTTTTDADVSGHEVVRKGQDMSFRERLEQSLNNGPSNLNKNMFFMVMPEPRPENPSLKDTSGEQFHTDNDPMIEALMTSAEEIYCSEAESFEKAFGDDEVEKGKEHSPKKKRLIGHLKDQGLPEDSVYAIANAKMKSSLADTCDDIIIKAKYIKRTGSAGNYKYTYKESKGHSNPYLGQKPIEIPKSPPPREKTDEDVARREADLKKKSPYQIRKEKEEEGKGLTGPERVRETERAVVRAVERAEAKKKAPDPKDFASPKEFEAAEEKHFGKRVDTYYDRSKIKSSLGGEGHTEEDGLVKIIIPDKGQRDLKKIVNKLSSKTPEGATNHGVRRDDPKWPGKIVASYKEKKPEKSADLAEDKRKAEAKERAASADKERVHSTSKDIASARIGKIPKGGWSKKASDGAEKGRKPGGTLDKLIEKSLEDTLEDIIKGKQKRKTIAHQIELDKKKENKLPPLKGFPKFAKGFLKAEGPGGAVFDFGLITGNRYVDEANELLNRSADLVQVQTANLQRNTYMKSLTDFIEKGETQEEAFIPMNKEWNQQFAKSTDQQIMEMQQKEQLHQQELDKSEYVVGGEKVMPHSETDKAILEMYKAGKLG